MRDWRKAYRPASFRGARFWVDEDGPDVGRRVAIHEISGGDVPIVEDMGRRATEFSVSAYVASDLADIEGRRLERACAAPGPAMLTLPMDPGQMALCTGCTRSRGRDKGGYISYRLDFVEAGGAGVLVIGGIGALRDVFAAGLADIGAAIGARL